MVDTAAGARADMDALIRDRVDAMVTARVDEIMALKEAERAAKPKKMAIIATRARSIGPTRHSSWRRRRDARLGRRASSSRSTA